MIEPSDLVFPNNAVKLISDRLATIDSDLFITKRPLRNTDPVQSIGVTAASWTPEEDSMEMKGVFTGSEPTISRYAITVQAFVRNTSEVEGLATHATLSRLVRTMLYRDTSLAVGLRTLSVVSGSYQETLRRWGIRNQRYFSNELNAQWLYLSTLDFWLETETV